MLYWNFTLYVYFIKASEYREWLLYFSIIVAKKSLPPAQFKHFSLFYHGIRLLFKEKHPPMKPYNNQKNVLIFFWTTGVRYTHQNGALTWFMLIVIYLRAVFIITPHQIHSHAFPLKVFWKRFKKNCSPGSRTLEQVVSFLNILKFKICFTFKRKITREFKICFDFSYFSYFRFTPVLTKKKIVETKFRSVTGNNQKHRIDKKTTLFRQSKHLIIK